MFRTVLGLFFLSLVTADSVLDLVDTDFDSKLADIETALVMFYAPWCGHCKKLKPEFEKSSADLLANDPPVHLVKVDCTEGGKDVCGKFEVKGYPTLKIFRNGELSSDYNGPRESNGITKFMRGQVGAASKDLKTVADAEALITKGEVFVVGFGDQPAHAKAAAKLRENFVFAHTTSEEVMTKLGHKEGIVLFRPKTLANKFEESDVKFESGDVADWVKSNYHGICGVKTTDNAADFKNPLITAYYSVDYVKNAKGSQYWRNRVMKVAVEFDSFNYAVANKDDFQHELSEYGFDYVAGDKPVVTAKDDAGLKYKMEPVTEAKDFMPKLKDFLTQFEAGNLDPYMKSEEVPDNSDPSLVKIAVAKNFDELVTKNEKDVLVEFYAPWCGHCKKLTPIFDDLAVKMANEDVEIVKMDATANDVPSAYDVKGFPTLFWIPKDTKKILSYNGGRELDDFVQYIAKEATTELNSLDRKAKEKKAEL